MLLKSATKNSAYGIIIFGDPECFEILPSGSWLFIHAAEGKNFSVLIDKTTDQSFLLITIYFSAMPDHGFYGPFPGSCSLVFGNFPADPGFKVTNKAFVFHQGFAGSCSFGKGRRCRRKVEKSANKDSREKEGYADIFSLNFQNLYHFFRLLGLYMATRFLPFSLARYRASSARPMNSFFLKSRPVGWALATPIEIVT